MENFIENNYKYYSKNLSNIPPFSDVANINDDIIHFLFPLKKGMSEHEYKSMYFDIYHRMTQALSSIVENAEKIAEKFFKELPEVHTLLIEDANALLLADPAAKNIQEVIALYPGFYATCTYRIANLLDKQGVPLLPRMMTEHAHSRTGIDIHPKANIGKRFSIDHGTGIVIGETTTIGEDVKIYQGVTLGALSVEKNGSGTKRHPTIENNVVIYAGSTILGGNTVVGHHSIIGGNVWLIESVAPYSVVYNKSETKIRNSKDNTNPM